MPKPPMLNQPKKKVIRACFFALTRSLNQFQFEGCYLMNLSLQKLQDEKKGASSSASVGAQDKINPKPTSCEIA